MESARAASTADAGVRIAWTQAHMPLLTAAAEMAAGGQLRGLAIGICLHVEPKTAVLCRALRAAGASVVLTGALIVSADVAEFEVRPTQLDT